MRKSRESSDPYYDLLEDFDLIVSSFQSQYGIRLAKDLQEMKWNEFKTLLAGLAPDTILGRIVSIRSEQDRAVLKHFTRDQHRIRNQWLARNVKNLSETDMNQVLEQFKQAFMSMAR